ncbi:hypothetical protein QUB19_03050 [Microcoleus sp. B4-C5]|uniref:hypothetical protein n=1 Tax=unclassified Microcoleus TaxID=2642155 RepID=UPI002FD717BB
MTLIGTASSRKQWVILITMLPDLISQLRQVETKLYGEIEKQIANARQKEEEVIYAYNTWVKQFAEIRKDFDGIIQSITKAAANRILESEKERPHIPTCHKVREAQLSRRESSL